MKPLNIAASLALLLVLNACTMPQIKYSNNDTIKIIINSKSVIQGKSKLLYENRVNLSDININQKVLLVENRMLLTYEDVTVTSGYQFNYGINRVVSIVFPKYNASLITREGNLYFYELHSKEERVYIILENMNKKGLKIIYGMSEDDFLCTRDFIVDSKDTSKNKKTAQVSVLPRNNFQDYIKSEWSYKNIILDNLVSKIGSTKFMK